MGTTVSLGLIVGALLLLGRGMKRFGFKAPQSLPSDVFELLGRRIIDQRTAVHMVKCGSQVLVLSVGPEGARTLTRIDDPAEVDRIVEACQKPNPNVTPESNRSQGMSAESPSITSTAVKRTFAALLAFGITLATTVSAEAQSPRTRSATARQRDPVPTPPVAVNERPIGVQPAVFERDALPDSVSQSSGLPLSGSPQQLGLSLKMMVLLSVFSLVPSLLMMTTCFVRFAVSLGLLRQALGTQQGLPNQVLTAICLFLTILVMSPVWQRSYDEGIRPYTNPAAGESPIDEATAIARAVAPLRAFMSQQIDKADNADAIWMLLDFQRPAEDSPSASTWHEPKNYDEVPLTVLAPAYLLSELKVGFLIGFQLFLPFLVIDLVVAMILTSLGLTMMPPSMVSLPFKLLLFVLIDGWFLTVGMLLESVRVV